MKSMIFMCLALVIMAGIARVYMAGGLNGLLGNNSGSENFRLKAPKNVKAVTTDKDVEVYKWRDERGVMHFGEAPPESNVAVEKIELKNNQNVMKPIALKEKSTDESDIASGEMANPYSPEGMGQMITQTKALTETLNKQQAEKGMMLDGLNQR